VVSISLSKPRRSKGYLKVMIDHMLYEMCTIILFTKVSDSFYDSPLIRSSTKNMAHSQGYKERSETVIMPLFLGEHDFVTFTIPQSSTVNPIVVVVFASFTTKSLPHQWSQLCKNMSPSMTASVRLPLHPWQTLQPRSIPFVLCLCQYTEALVDKCITCHSNSP
jgi:hypothetical protein